MYTNCLKIRLECNMSFIVCVALCAVLFCVFCPIVVPLPPGKTPFAVQINIIIKLSDHRLSANLVPTFADIGCHVVSVMDPFGRILRFLDRSRYFFFLNCTHEAELTPFQTRYFCRAGNRTRTSGSVARNSDH
jgi:hypothetical protein